MSFIVQHFHVDIGRFLEVHYDLEVAYDDHGYPDNTIVSLEYVFWSDDPYKVDMLEALPDYLIEEIEDTILREEEERQAAQESYFPEEDE